MGSSHTLDQLDIYFDDTHAIANAGLLLPATLAERLGIQQAADALIDLGERPGAHWPGRKLLTWSTSRVPPTATPHPRLPPAAGHQGRHRRGAARPPAHRPGQHRPRHRKVRRRSGRTGTPRRRRRRADHAHGLRFLVGQDHPRLPSPWHSLLHHRPPDQADPAGDRGHDEAAWFEIVDPDGGLAQVAETRYRGDRLVVRRTRVVGAQAELFPNWRYHAFVTDRVGTTVEVDQDHRRHATVELCIRDLKAGVGLRHCPSGKFAANAAWLVIATWPTTCCAGSPPSGWEHARSWWWPRRCAKPCWPCPAGSPARPAA
jgi:hypothetical protein